MENKVLEIKKPGIWLVNVVEDKNKHIELDRLINLLISSFYEAHLSLNLFDIEYLRKKDLHIQNINNNDLTIYLEKQKVYLFAKMFLFSVDNCIKLLKTINKPDYNPPTIINTFINEFESFFPNLIKLRNSAHHIEDIARNLNKYSKKVELKSINNSFIKGSALILNSLNGKNYAQTLSDGCYGEVEVSYESLSKIHKIIQSTVNSYQWEGNERKFEQ